MRQAAGHTPGPWDVWPEEQFWTGDYRVGTFDEGKFTEVAFCDTERAEVKANARLIAAAPDMFDALQAHDDYMTIHYHDPDSEALHPDAAANWKRVRAAIARAKSGSDER
jgi:hypothetical protein